MNLSYPQNIDVRIDRGDLAKLFRGRVLSGSVRGQTSGRVLSISAYASREEFYSCGTVGEDVDGYSFQGWGLDPVERPEGTTLAEELEEGWIPDHHTLKIRISIPAVRALSKDKERMVRNGGYFCGIARGTFSGHLFDRLNFHLNLNRR